MSLAEICACLEMSMWSFSGGMTLKCCSSKIAPNLNKQTKQILNFVVIQ